LTYSYRFLSIYAGASAANAATLRFATPPVSTARKQAACVSAYAMNASIAARLAPADRRSAGGVTAHEQPLMWVAVDDPDVPPLLASSAPCW
jgi:hypothetical protein